MSIYEALKLDHLKLMGLLAELVQVSDGDKSLGDGLVESIRAELVPHSRAEEAVFYNSIRAVSSAQDLLWHSYSEHIEAEGLLHTLEILENVNLDWHKTAAKLKAALEHHIAEEEGKIFEIAQHLFTRDEAVTMAETFLEMKAEVEEGSIVQSTLDLIANMLPDRLATPLRTLTLHERTSVKH